MATATTIDTLELARELREGGVEEKPAATIAQAIKRGVESTPAPTEIAQIKAENADIKTRLGRIETDIAEVKANQRWQKWLLGIIIAALIGVFWKLTALTAMVERLAQ